MKPLRLITVMCLVAVILSLICGVKESRATETGMQKLIYNNQSAFSRANDEMGGKGNSEGVWLNRFLQKLDSKGTNVTTDDWERALHGLVRIGKHKDVPLGNTGFIQDAVTVEVLAAALKHESRPVREIAVRSLTWETRQSDLERYSKEIKSGLGADLKSDDVLLLARLPLGADEKRALLSRPRLSAEVRARLGDSASEQEIIRSFEAESDYQSKRKLARQLAYIGTDNCTRALVTALQSPVASYGRYEDRSIRIDILLSLGKIFPSQDIFTNYAIFLSENSDAIFDRKYGLVKYISDIDTWVRKHFDKPAWGKVPVWFVRFHNVPITR
jgi:HEAT repeat protein